MKVSHFLRSKWTLAVLIILGLIYFEGHVISQSVERHIASDSQAAEPKVETSN